ncbi:MAG: xanthine dehydrogenase [Gammaproteobacteria bacterium RIFCSPHIGHO2_12_FULL_42_13]|nr:MAG: xanthine dehydrogenase [Gammaproteobacteria bacterium RIFCSPHIGHO2_12_FULL_42_13]
MHKHLPIWNLIIQSLDQHIPVTLLYVLESLGSSPGRQGFFMAVNAHGKMAGSIGGGIMEHRFVEIAKKKITQDQNLIIRKQVHDKISGKNSSGMICSGEQSILLYLATSDDKSAIQNIILLLEKNRNGTLILSPNGIKVDETTPFKDHEFVRYSEENWCYKEKLGYKNLLSIIGGGHCSLAFSEIMRQMDFYINVYDKRPELKTMLENNAAHEKHVIADYAELAYLIPPGRNHYVVIMTFGYRTDDIVLRALLNKEFRYLGLLGSKAKIKKMFAAYRKENFLEQQIQYVYTPAGIPIKSRTPEEIAISIAAEIIREKNKYLP